jgi:hypothetical protein
MHGPNAIISNCGITNLDVPGCKQATEDADLWRALTVTVRSNGAHLVAFLKRRQKGIRELALCVPMYPLEAPPAVVIAQAANVAEVVQRVGLLLQEHCPNLETLSLNGQYARIIRHVALRTWPTRLTSLEVRSSAYAREV